MPELAQFFLARHFFRTLARLAREAVLRELLDLLAADEVRHAQGASDLLAQRLGREPDIREVVLDAAVGVRYFGDEAASAVPVIEDEDASIERLCGVRLVDHLKRSL